MLTGRIDHMGGADLDRGARYEPRGARGRKDEPRASEGPGSSEVDAPADIEHASLMRDKAGAARRRAVLRSSRRPGDAHEVHGRDGGHLTDRAVTLDLDLDLSSDDDAGGGGRSLPADEDRRSGAAAAAAFEALTEQLVHLGDAGPIHELTLNLPALGRVTARPSESVIGGVDLDLCVEPRLLGAVERGAADLRAQLRSAGLPVGTLKIAARKEPPPPAAPAHRWRDTSGSEWGDDGRRSLIDVMA